MIAYLQLLRLPNLFTAMAGLLMGFFWAHLPWSTDTVVVLCLVLSASSFFYLAGMVLNDWFDLEIDRRERPHRPLPSGRISQATAARLGWGLWGLGILAGWGASLAVGHWRTGLIATALAAAIVSYNGLTKSTWFGPLNMGVCRMLNVLLGMSVADRAFSEGAWLIASAVGIYIVGITWFARREAEGGRRLEMIGAMVVMVAGILLLTQLPQFESVRLAADQWMLFVAVLAALVALQCRRAVLRPTPEQMQTVVRLCLFSLVLIDASVTMALRGPICALVVLGLLLPTLVLGRWVYST